MILKNVEKKENNTALFTVESDAAEFEAAVNGAYLKAKSSINIPGFRKGKAPWSPCMAARSFTRTPWTSWPPRPSSRA